MDCTCGGDCTCALYHTCVFLQTRRGPGQTVLEVNSADLSQLPLQDFLPVDYGVPSQAFGFEVGPLCLR